MEDILFKLLPDNFKKSKFSDAEYVVENLGIKCTVKLHNSPYSVNEKDLMLSISVYFLSDYCEILDFEHLIFQASIIDGKVDSLDGNLKNITHFNCSNVDGLEYILNTEVVPFFQKMLIPEVFIEFLERSLLVGKDGKDEEHRKVFGGILLEKQYDSMRVRNQKLGFLATIYGRIGDTYKLKYYLEKFLPFYENDGSKNLTDDEKKSRNIVVEKIKKDLFSNN